MAKLFIIFLLTIFIIGCFEHKPAKVVRYNIFDCQAPYIVKRGDTLSKLAKTCHIPVADLARINSLIFPFNINEGMSLNLSISDKLIVGKDWQMPIASKIIKKYKPNSAHKGLTFASRDGQKIFAVADGQVVHIDNRLLGHKEIVIIEHSNNIYSAYTQTKDIIVKKNDLVKMGQQIATATDSNFYFEMRDGDKNIDPLYIIKK